MPVSTNSDTAPSPAVGCEAVFAASSYTFPAGEGWISVVGGWTQSPDTQVVFQDSGGLTPFPSIPIDFPSVRILVRGRPTAGGYAEGYAVAIGVRDSLLGIPSAPTQYPVLTSVRGMGHIQWLGRDDKNRPQWSFNLSLIVSYDESGYRT